MPQLSENETNISITATDKELKPDTHQHGLAKRDGTTIIQNQIQNYPLTIESLRMINSGVELMIQRGSLTISAVTKEITRHLLDNEGNPYSSVFDTVIIGHKATVTNPTEDDIKTLQAVTMPGHRRGIQTAIEHLAQIKPIGKSHVKQSTVIAYLSFDLHDIGVSEYVVQEICKEYRRDDTITYFPNTAEFFRKAEKRMQMYKGALAQLQPQIEHKINPDPGPEEQEEIARDPKPWDDFTLEDMPDHIKFELLAFLKPVGYTVKKIYCWQLGFEFEDFIKSLPEKDKKNENDNQNN